MISRGRVWLEKMDNIAPFSIIRLLWMVAWSRSLLTLLHRGFVGTIKYWKVDEGRLQNSSAVACTAGRGVVRLEFIGDSIPEG